MTTMPIRDASLYVKIAGAGYPLLLLHGGPGVDHTTLLPMQPLADQFTLVFYDQRGNGRSTCADLSAFTWENLTADAEALRAALGFEQWAVLGHSFGGMVALEYALRYPHSLSHLLLVDTCADTWWVQQHAPQVLAERGYSAAAVEAARRFFNGELAPDEVTPAMLKFAKAYFHRPTLWTLLHNMLSGFKVKMRPQTLIYGFGHLLRGWSVMDRLPQIETPTLVLAGRHDFQFPPQHQKALAAGLPNAQLKLIENAGHNAPQQRPQEIIHAVRSFIAG
jgi:proline iminopeptidase